MATQLELFKATINHEAHDSLLFHAGFTPDLRKRMRRHLNLSEEDGSIQEHLGMYCPQGVNLEAPEDYQEPDFSAYYEDAEKPEGSSINGLGMSPSTG